MATVSKTPANLEGIPAQFQRKPNGQGQPDIQALLDKIAELEAKVAAKNTHTLKLKVSEKGCVSLYGTGRFPLTLYASTWIKVLDMAQEIRDFIEANKASLAWK